MSVRLNATYPTRCILSGSGGISFHYSIYQETVKDSVRNMYTVFVSFSSLGIVQMQEEDLHTTSMSFREAWQILQWSHKDEYIKCTSLAVGRGCVSSREVIWTQCDKWKVFKSWDSTFFCPVWLCPTRQLTILKRVYSKLCFQACWYWSPNYRLACGQEEVTVYRSSVPLDLQTFFTWFAGNLCMYPKQHKGGMCSRESL